MKWRVVNSNQMNNIQLNILRKVQCCNLLIMFVN